MHPMRPLVTITLALGLILATGACAPAAAPATPTPAPTKAPAAPAAAPTQPPKAAAPAAATPTTAAPAPTKPPTTPATAAGVSVADLANKAKANPEYSYTSKITSAGQALTAKTYVKSNKMRQEMSVAGRQTTMLLDLSSKTAYVLLTDQQMAMKMDFSQALAQSDNPSDRMTSLPADSKFVGTETVDGKPTAIYEVPVTGGSSKVWVWTDRGLPVKIETTGTTGQTTVEFTEFQFGSQPDSLFELPPGTQVLDVPGAIPGVPGKIPVPGK